VAPSCGRPPRSVGGVEARLEATLVEIEAGRKTTPLVERPVPGGDATVTFLARGSDGLAPRIVSDATGWGERTADNSFDLTVGRMSRIGSSDWYRLETRVASGARVRVPDRERRVRLPDRPAQPQAGDVPRRRSRFGVRDARLRPAAGVHRPAAGAERQDDRGDDRQPRARRVTAAIVYTPAGCRAGGAYPVAVFHSGWGAAAGGRGGQGARSG